MRVHVLRHVPFEGPGLVAEWAEQNGHETTESFAFTEEFPSIGDVDFLLVLGGPMSAADEPANPWLVSEKRFIAEAMDAGKLVLGICLGAQIIAEVAGGRIRKCDYPEIGWYPVRKTEAAATDPLFGVFPDVLVVGHWHGETFDLPQGVMPVLTSDACANQAFTLNGGRVVGLQFHLEWSEAALDQLVDECIDELVDGGPYLTTAPDILARAPRYIPGCQAALNMLLDLMVSLAEVKR